MATKIHHHPEFAGARELFLLLDLLQDPDKYQELYERLEGERQAVNALLEGKGIAGDIDAQLALAQADRATAARELALARSGSSEKLQAAGLEADQMLATARAECSRIASETARLRADADAAARAASAKLRELEARELEAREKVASAGAMMADAQELRRQYEGKAAVLSEALQLAQAG